MTDDVYNDVALEKFVLTHFKKKLEVKQAVVRNVPVGLTANATLFMAPDNRMYAYIQAEAPLILDDVRKIISRMNLEADAYFPPAGEKDYFKAFGIEKFKSTFPGRHVESEHDYSFYTTLAPYNPALVHIKAIKAGEVKQFDLDSKQWRLSARYSYRRLKPLSEIK